MEIFNVTSNFCPNCAKHLDAATGQTAPPQPGDITICIGCGIFLTFGQDMKVHVTTEAELESVKQDPTFNQVIAFAAHCRAIYRDRTK